ncbi:MAG TPA: hypothetical protein VGB50_10270 [Flavobacterium sp.]|jgi:hypothetical protein
MTTNITTLAINLLISERESHRSFFADRITELVQESNDVSDIEKELKNKFFSVISKCVENPNRESADVFYQLAQFYNQKIHGNQSALSAAA